MKKILIISDSHGRDKNMKYVIAKEKPIDVLIHLGDLEGSEEFVPDLVNKGCEVYMVRGNNDYFSETLPAELEIELCGHHIFLTHGHAYSVSYGVETLLDEAVARGCDIAMFGHTHRPYLNQMEGVALVNPGSLSYPRQNDRRPSYIVLEMDDDGTCYYHQHYLDK